MNLGMLVLISLVFPYQQAQEDFDKARVYYNQGLVLRHDATQARPFFKLSSVAFRNCVGHLPETPVFFREWASAELLAGNPAHALMVSRRGLRLFPCDASLLKINHWLLHELNLEEAVTASSVQVLGSRNILFIIAALNLFGWVAIFRTRSKLRKIGFFIVCGCVLYACTVIPKYKGKQGFAFNAIVAEKPLYLKVGNESSYPNHSGLALKPATQLKILDHQDDWFLVNTLDGRYGWVMANDILIDLGN